MSAEPPKFRVFFRTGIAVVVLSALAVIVFYQFRATALVATVTRGPAVDVVTGSVVVHAEKDLQEIRSELGGRVNWIDPRQLGEPFKKDEPIVKLDSSDIARDMKQAEEEYNAYIERLKRQKQDDPRLQVAKDFLAVAERRHSRGELSDDELKSAQRALDKIQTDLALEDLDAKQKKVDFENGQEARQRALDKMTIRAPMDGILQSVMVAPGALIVPGTTVANFFSNQRVVIAKVGEEDISRVKVGQPARVRLLNTGETVNANVTTILPFADPDTQRYSVYLEVKADPGKLIPFSTGEATITVGRHENQPLIPRRALFNDEYVLVVKGGVIEKRKISIGFKALNYAEVTGSLEPGEQVVVEDVDQFRDGQHVRTESAR